MPDTPLTAMTTCSDCLAGGVLCHVHRGATMTDTRDDEWTAEDERRAVLRGSPTMPDTPEEQWAELRRENEQLRTLLRESEERHAAHIDAMTAAHKKALGWHHRQMMTTARNCSFCWNHRGEPHDA